MTCDCFGKTISGKCDCPKSVQQHVSSLGFDQQLDRLLGQLDKHSQKTFLAGVRFALGHKAYGDQMFTMPTHQLQRELLEERADAIVYELELKARNAND